MHHDDIEALRAAAARYAAGVDRRDAEMFLSAFHPDATVTIPPLKGTGDPHVVRGHEELVQVVERIRRYERTFHFLGQLVLEPGNGEDVARAEVACVAHHWRTNEGRVEDTVMFIRYEDEYRRGADGAWRIATRILHLDARETHDVTEASAR